MKYFFTYVGSFNFFCWLPVFFLFFNTHVDSGDVLWLEAIYYFSVTLCEVPSGYFSDRIGRKKTLFFATLSLAAAYSIFCTSSSFMFLAVGQILLGCAFALNSGTDTSLLYELLKKESQEDQFPELQAKAGHIAQSSTAWAVIVGGLIATIDIRLPYAISGIASFVALYAVGRLPSFSVQDRQPDSFLKQMDTCWQYAKHQQLKWILLFAASTTVLNHIVYEFAQPYLVLIPEIGPSENVYWISAGLFSIAMFIGALSTKIWSAKLSRINRLKTASLIYLMHLASMTMLVVPTGWWGALGVIGRGVPSGLSGNIINTWTTPLLPQEIRATYLSIQSLMGRLVFGLLLFVMGSFISSSTLKHDDIINLLSIPIITTALGWIVSARLCSGNFLRYMNKIK